MTTKSSALIPNFVDNSTKLNARNLNTIKTAISKNEDEIIKLKGQNESILYVKLNDWGIYNGFLTDRQYLKDEQGNPIPKYTNDEYKIAYDNKYGLINALNFAKENGYGTVVLPKCEIFICYEEKNASVNVYHAYGKYPIVIPSGITLDLNGSTIKVIYDSKCINPYDKSDHTPANNPPYKLPGVMFSFSASYNSCIKNGNLIGDLYERAFDDTATGWDRERACEFTTGIIIDRGSSYSSIDNLIIKGFMGDAIASMTDHDPAKGKAVYNPKFSFLGGIGNDGLLNTVTTSYSTDFCSIEDWNTKECIMRTNIGYSRVPNFKNHNFIISFYNQSKTYLFSTTQRYLQTILVPYNAKFFRLTITNEPADLTLGFVRDFQVTPMSGEYCVISKCQLTENHRGGISNMVNNTIIEKCKIFNNGQGTYEGVPQFPDTTRYAINCEDCLPLSLTIRDTYFFDHFNGILFAGGNVTVDNCIFKNMSSCLYIYNNESAFFTNNKMFNCGNAVGTTNSSVYERRVVVMGNRCINTNLVNVSAENATVIADNNYIDGVGGINVNSTSLVSNLIFNYKKMDDAYRGITLFLKNANNIFVYLNDNFISTARAQIESDETCKDIFIKNKTSVHVNFASAKLCNAYIEDIAILKITSTIDGLNTANFYCNNTIFKNCKYNSGEYVNGSDQAIKMNLKNCSITNDGTVAGQNPTNIYGYNFYNNEYYKIFALYSEKCSYDMSVDSLTSLILLPTGKMKGTIIFNNCTFINNKINDATIHMLNTHASSNVAELTVEFINCTFIGKFNYSNNTNFKIKVNGQLLEDPTVQIP